MPVDEHGQLIDMSKMTEEEKKAVKYHPRYALSELLHIGKEEQSFIFAGYQWGPGNTDELVQGKALVTDFIDDVGKGVMKLLICDRGFISGKLRTQIEERHRQSKKFWHINEFSSPNESLIEAHVMFTLLTYSLVQLYLNKKHLNALANKIISSLKREEQMGINSVIVYSENYFAVFDLDDYTEIIVDLKDEARLRLQKWIKRFKRRDKFRGR